MTYSMDYIQLMVQHYIQMWFYQAGNIKLIETEKK